MEQVTLLHVVTLIPARARSAGGVNGCVEQVALLRAVALIDVVRVQQVREADLLNTECGG